MTVSYEFIKGTSPIVATAIHEGHDTRDELSDLFNETELYEDFKMATKRWRTK